jgi:hypothetical protein
VGFAPPSRDGFAFIAAPEHSRMTKSLLTHGREGYAPYGVSLLLLECYLELLPGSSFA